jgi:cytochrome c-type biogenesis protein CcmH
VSASSRRIPWAALGLASLLVVAAGSLAVVASRAPVERSSMEERVHAVAASLRCPVCQNLSVADSSSELARQMRVQIGRELEAGKSADAIRGEFVAAYGEWILLEPPVEGLNLVVWIGPGLLLLGGLVVAAIAVRRWSAVGDPSSSERKRVLDELSSDDRRLLDRELSRMREEPE